MSKLALGRGLGALVGPECASGQAYAPKTMDGGLRILAEASPAASFPRSHPLGLTTACVAAVLATADVTLLSWTAHFAITHRNTMAWLGIAGCISTTLIAAACGRAAVLIPHLMNDNIRSR